MMNLPIILEHQAKKVPVKYCWQKTYNSSARFKNGALELRMSAFLSHDKRLDTAWKFVSWGKKQLARLDCKFLDAKPKLLDGVIIKTLAKSYVLRVNEDRSSGNLFSLKLKNSAISLYIYDLMKCEDYQREIWKLIRKLISKDNQQFLEQTLQRLNQLYIAGNVASCRFKNQMLRFGSCSRKGNINISSRLLLAPQNVFEYVCIHELAHLRYFNHSRQFWDLVERADPDYRNKQAWLSINGAFF